MNIKKKQTKSSALAFSKWLSEMEDKPIDTSQNHEKKGREKSDEIQTQSTIIDYLELRALKGELFFQRTNNSPVFDGVHYRSMSKGQKKGWPDIICLIKGKFIAIEVKSSRGDQSTNQVEIEKLIIKHGGVYLLVRSLPFLEGKIEELLL